MYIVYFDETGNTGTNYDDPQQRVFLLGAMVVPEAIWQNLEKDLAAEVEKAFTGSPAVDNAYYFGLPNNFEVHGVALRNGSGFFREFSVGVRVAFRDAWLAIAQRHGVKFIYRAIEKGRFRLWVHGELGSGVKINPYVVAFPLVARVVDEYLAGCPGKPLGIFVFDENKEVVHDIEKSLSLLRGINNSLRLGRVVEKGFFIDSAKSLMLQLCDVCLYYARKKEEQALGLPAKEIDRGGILGIEPLVYKGNEAFHDVLAWVTGQQKKERPGDKPTVG
jgi:hypothetical protein